MAVDESKQWPPSAFSMERDDEVGYYVSFMLADADHAERDDLTVAIERVPQCAVSDSSPRAVHAFDGWNDSGWVISQHRSTESMDTAERSPTRIR